MIFDVLHLVRLLTISVSATIISSAALGLESPDEPDEVSLAVPDEQVSPAAQPELGPNLLEIMTPQGLLLSPWTRQEGCIETGCAEAIVNSETGEVAFFDGAWMGGFLRTENGEQIVRIVSGPETGTQGED